MDRSYFDSDIKLLWGYAAGMCSFPGCRTQVLAKSTGTDAAAVLGFICHISAHSSGGPRYDSSLPSSAVDRYENLILLCGHHHTLVDKQPNTYTSDDLKKWKRDHEEWVKASLAKEMPLVNSIELQLVTSAIVDNPEPFDTDYKLTDPRTKMAKNELSDRVLLLVSMGLSKSREVARFVQRYSTIDAEFSEKLRSSFVTQYRLMRDSRNLRGDALFFALADFASNGKTDLKFRCAGLAVLMYLFERCEVFEK